MWPTSTAPDASIANRIRLLVILLYVASPVFALLDWWLGWSMRVPSLLDGPSVSKIAYYSIITVLGIMMLALPRRVAAMIATVESAFHVALTGIAIILRHAATIDRATDYAQSQARVPINEPIDLIGTLISVGTLIICVLARQIDFLETRRFNAPATSHSGR